MVRELRYQLRTGPLEALRDVTGAGLGALAADDRGTVLRTIQAQLVAGARLTPDDVAEIARLAVMGERREAGAVIRHLPGGVLDRLASAVVPAGRAAGLSEGYAAWDGSDPVVAPTEGDAYRSGFDAARHYEIVKGKAEGGFSV